jgi:acyl-coenzyme A synthetase/AMP-(fatty) acid ligase
MERVLEILEAGRLTKFFSVPTIYIRLLTLPDLKKKLGKLRYCFSAGAAMAMEIVKQWKERTGITIAESYGMTEVMPITFNHYDPEKHMVGSVGRPVLGVEVQIRDAGGNLSRLSPFKVPKQCVVIDEFPKSPQGKILKRQLRKRALEGLATQGRDKGSP